MNALAPYARLVRLPNLPTALADVTLAALAVGALPARWVGFLLLLASSSCLYMAGMVLNDVFDAEEDRRERPDRPIPSGQVSAREAALLGIVLLVFGVLFASAAGWALVQLGQATSWVRPPLMAALLVVSILAYDGGMKHSVLGPTVMGLCRFLNVMLGVTIAGSFAWPVSQHLATVVGLYIAGVTTFARTETQLSRKSHLAVAASIILVALAAALALPVHRPVDTASPLFVYLLVALGFFVGFPILRAIVQPTPALVQAAVKRCLVGLILLDAVLATALAGTVGLAILVLLAPSLWL